MPGFQPAFSYSVNLDVFLSKVESNYLREVRFTLLPTSLSISQSSLCTSCNPGASSIVQTHHTSMMTYRAHESYPTNRNVFLDQHRVKKRVILH